MIFIVFYRSTINVNPLITEEYRMIQSFHTCGERYLYLQSVLCTGTITYNKYGYLSPTHGGLSLIHVVLCAHMHP